MSRADELADAIAGTAARADRVFPGLGPAVCDQVEAGLLDALERRGVDLDSPEVRHALLELTNVVSHGYACGLALPGSSQDVPPGLAGYFVTGVMAGRAVARRHVFRREEAAR